MTEILKTSNSSFSQRFESTKPSLSTKRYEVKAPEIQSANSQLVHPENVITTTKEEEWITKKKVELTTKKQIETRVKRQVVLEDGKVVEDSGPVITTNTTKDTEKQEHEQTEHRNLGDTDPPKEGWIVVPDTSGLIKEICENKVKSREETEEVLETEDVHHLGDITDDAYLKAIQSQRKDLRLALRQASSELLSPVVPQGRVVHHSRNNRKVTDTENTKHLTEVQSDGRIVTETTKSSEHEEVNNEAKPDDDDDDDDFESHRKSSQRFRKTKDQELVEYISNGVKVGEEMKFEAENVEGDRRGDPQSLKIDHIEWESLSERIRRMQREKQQRLEAQRTDALTKKPLNIDQEEQTRKVETSKWLEHHFGSESQSSRSSTDGDERPKKTKTSTSFINVTMKSSRNPSTPSKNSLYKGISEWNGNTSRHSISNGISDSKSGIKSSTATKKHIYEVQTGNVMKISTDDRSYSNSKPITEKIEKSNTSSQYFTEKTSTPVSSPLSELEACPLYSSIQRKYKNTDKSSSSFDLSSSTYPEKVKQTNGNASTNGILKSTSPSDQYYTYNNEQIQEGKKYNSVKRERMNKMWSQSERRLTDIGSSEIQMEPHPDYSPRLNRKTPSSPDIRSSPSIEPVRKKVFKKTRFSAEIPLLKPKRSTATRLERKSSSLGDTFRKIFGKFQSNGNRNAIDSKKKPVSNVHQENTINNNNNNNNNALNSSADSNHHNSYQSFSNVDHNIPIAIDTTNDVETRGSRTNLQFQPKQTVKYTMSYEDPETLRNRNTILTNGFQSLDRKYKPRKQHSDYGTAKRRSPAQKYYLGEDPFNGSIYGKEKEYDGKKRVEKKYNKNGSSTDDERRSVKSQIINGMNKLGSKFSKSTNKLASDDRNDHLKPGYSNHYEDRGVQTLPRKSRKQVFINDPSSDQENMHSKQYQRYNSNGSSNAHRTSNNYSPGLRVKETDYIGPQKPARTYKSSLLRSKSFNVQLGPQFRRINDPPFHRSNLQLNKLNEYPPPLKSPGIVTSISRSSVDLSSPVDDDRIRNEGYMKTYSNNSRRPYLKGLKNQAPVIYKTVHEDEEDENPSVDLGLSNNSSLRNKRKNLEYSKSFHGGNTTKKPTVSFKSDYYATPIRNYRTTTR